MGCGGALGRAAVGAAQGAAAGEHGLAAEIRSLHGQGLAGLVWRWDRRIY